MPANDDTPFDLMIGKLSRLRPLDDAAVSALRALSFRKERVDAGSVLVREGDRPTDCCLLMRGFACRYKVTCEGARQIVSFHIAGDLLDIQHLMLERADHSVMMITDGSVAWLGGQDVRDILSAHPAVNAALWRDSLIDASIFREWVLNVGRREAKVRIAHMLCEFATRREAAGLGGPEDFELPMTQEEIADATGLTAVHVNRMLHALEEDGVLVRNRRQYKITDWSRMRQVADFDPAYLHAAAA